MPELDALCLARGGMRLWEWGIIRTALLRLACHMERIKMKTIGLFHYQLGRTDGVSLEVDKWRHALEEMGHTVQYCAGDLGTAEGTLIEEMYHHRPDAERLNRNTFGELVDYDDDLTYRSCLLYTSPSPRDRS